MIAIQYLEDCPELEARPIAEVRERLRAAGAKLPLDAVLVGWRLPPTMLEACRQESQRLGATFYCWHPLLTGDGVFYPRPEWRVIGLSGYPLTDFSNMPEFTFVCPNRPQARAAVLERIEAVIRSGAYQGVFLDRMRFPSPAATPLNKLGCFCPSCHEAAASQGLDLAHVRATLVEWAASSAGKRDLVRFLLSPLDRAPDSPQAQCLQSFLRFRCQSITELVRQAAQRLRAAGMLVGLDCFSPALMPMVGQDLRSLSRYADWTKLMCYAHTLGPAGMPFELAALADRLAHRTDLDERGALELLSQASDLPLPGDRATLRARGLSARALRAEVERGVSAAATPVLFGIELVEIAGVTHLSPAQIREDLSAVRAANPAGLALSWDLWDMPLDRLELVGEVWLREVGNREVGSGE